jgi:hypothetical protein
MKLTFPYRVILAILGLSGLPALAGSHPVTVAARGLNVRTADGEILCSVPNGTTLDAVGRHADGERLKVKLPKLSGRCAGIKDGFVAASFVRSVGTPDMEESLIEPAALSLRSKPNLDDAHLLCSLPQNTRVSVVPDSRRRSEEVTWVKVKLLNPRKGCKANEGYVAEAYLKGGDLFGDLPVLAETADEDDSPNCGGPGCVSDKRDPQVKSMERLSKGIGKKITDENGKPGPFLTGLKKMIKAPRARPAGLNTSRGLVQIPLAGNRGPCGSFHYNADKPLGVDAYANPLTACVFTSVLQDWKKDYCPDRKAGCRFSWGDISHKSKPMFNTHRTHTDGYCIDIRPMQKGEFSDSPVTYQSRGYDKRMMRKLVELLREKGGTAMYFNDTSLGTRAVHGHHNHIHVCFKDNPTTRAVCNNLKVDPNVCPELQ